MKYGKGWIPKVLLLLLVLYSPSLPHQAECPSGSFCQAGRSICLGCVHADRQPCSCWSSVTTYTAIIRQDTCLPGPHRAQLTPKQNVSPRERGKLCSSRPSILDHHGSTTTTHLYLSNHYTGWVWMLGTKDAVPVSCGAEPPCLSLRQAPSALH